MATVDAPVVALYDARGRMRDWLRAPQSVRAVPRWLEAGEAELVVQMSDPRATLLREPGTRAAITLRGEHVLGGPVTAWNMQGPEQAGWTFTVTDDAAVLDRLLILPDPTKPLNQQPSGARPLAGAVESVLKLLVAQAAPLLGVPVDIVADKGRGPQITVTPRWQSVAEVMTPHLRAAGLGVSVIWQPTTGRLLLDVVESRTYPIQLSPESRTMTGWRVSSAAPVTTRVYLGAADGTTYQQATSAAVETEWGPFLRGATFRAADTPDEASTVGTEALNEGGPKSGLSVSLNETGMVRYGGPTGFRVGDRVTLRIGDVDVDDVVREAVIEWAPGKPLTVTPGVGAWDNSPLYALGAAVRRIAASVNRYTHR